MELNVLPKNKLFVVEILLISSSLKSFDCARAPVAVSARIRSAAPAICGERIALVVGWDTGKAGIEVL